MPTNTLEQLNPTRIKLTVNVSAEEIAPFMDKAYKTVANQVKIPGFRPGKVPAGVIDQRVGKGPVLEQAINDSLDSFFSQAMSENDHKPIFNPEVDVVEMFELPAMTGKLVLAYEVEVRPEFKLPNFSSIKITVSDIEVSDTDIQAELDELRARFGNLVPVDRPVKLGDFVSIDLDAEIDGEKIDSASGVSYEVGSGNLLEGIDEALITLTADEVTSFKSTLLGGDHAGKEAEITVKVLNVKERELPEVDDAFAQLASEFDTVKELKDSLVDVVKSKKVQTVGLEAKDLFVDELIKKSNVPVSEVIVKAEVDQHLKNENRAEDDDHRAEVVVEAEKSFALNMILDTIIEENKVTPTQNEISEYLFASASQYGLEPGAFINLLQQNNQISAVLSEVSRNKALAIALGQASVTSKNGEAVDLSDFTKVDEGDSLTDSEVSE